MPSRLRTPRYALICLAVLEVLAAFSGDLQAQPSTLGKIDFATSGSPQAQTCFLRGVAALHSFWYEEAAAQFRECTQAEPDFMMGYWGEAMTYNHPIWAEQDAESARNVLSKIQVTSNLTAQERAYLSAVQVLYGAGDKLSRDIAYSRAMQKIYNDDPHDLEAACFYALSLLGTVRPGDKGFSRQMHAGAIALDVFEKNPNHPGAAHYIIHAFDDPEHAILALPAARRYAQIAPDAHHARHMPAHIFLQLGMWPEEIASNISAWQASVNWVERRGLSLTLRDYHSLYWELYGRLQQGQYGDAEKLLEQKRKDMADTQEKANLYAAQMAAAYMIETQRWDLAGRIFSMVGIQDAVTSAGGRPGGQHAAHAPGPSAAMMAFATGYAAAASGSPSVQPSIAALDAIAKGITAPEMRYRAKQVEIQKLELEGLDASRMRNHEIAIETLKKAVALEETNSPPSGPPDVIKPPHELLAEVLLAAGHDQEAAQMFAVSLARQPNRARSLLGSARAAQAMGDAQAAAQAYSDFLLIWREADSNLPELAEARKFAKTASD
jgi:tetratricopeptide (TPR) repeat protein